MKHTDTSLRVNGYTFRGSNSIIFIFASPISGVNSLTKEFAPLDPPLIGLHCPGKQTGSRKVVSLCKNDRKSCRVLKHLKILHTGSSNEGLQHPCMFIVNHQK